MKHYISLLALGDNLISLSMLEQIDTKVKVLGTKHTKNVAKLMEVEEKLDIEVIFDDIPAFYDMKKQGIVKSIKDFYKFIQYIRDNNIDEIVFEKKDFRSNLVSIFTSAKLYYPDIIEKNVYQNRKQLIQKVYNHNISLNSYTLELNNSKIVVINPLTRVDIKNIKHEHLRYIIDMLNQNNYKIYLLDIDKKYQEFENETYSYLTNTTLDDVKQLIKRSDLYIGGDSFLIHLAYYLKKNYFMIFYRDNDDFLPPNIEDNFYINAHKVDDFNQEMKKKFKNIGVIK